MAKARILPIFVPHVGCPHQCVFCDQRTISGQTRPPAPEEVEESLAYALAALPPSEKAEIAFYGGSFTAMDREYMISLLDVADFFARRREGITVRFSTRPDAMDEEILSVLSAYPVSTIELGVQSLSEKVLRASGRGHTREDAYRAARLVKNAGYRLILQMMTGLPGDGGEESLQTAKEICGLQPDGVRIYPTVVVRDTPLHKRMLQGQYEPQTVEEAVALCSRIVPLFEKAQIPIIRLGLNPTEELSGGEAVAGAYHPALGELVYGRVYRNRVEELLSAMDYGKEIEITVPKGKTSLMVGQKKCNREYFYEKYGFRSVVIVESCENTGIFVKNIVKAKDNQYNK